MTSGDRHRLESAARGATPKTRWRRVGFALVLSVTLFAQAVPAFGLTDFNTVSSFGNSVLVGGYLDLGQPTGVMTGSLDGATNWRAGILPGANIGGSALVVSGGVPAGWGASWFRRQVWDGWGTDPGWTSTDMTGGSGNWQMYDVAADAQNAIAVGSYDVADRGTVGGVWASLSGGAWSERWYGPRYDAQWDPDTGYPDANAQLRSVDMVSGLAVAVGTENPSNPSTGNDVIRGLVVASTDGGQTWTRLESIGATNTPLVGVDVVSASVIWAVGQYLSSASMVYRSTDGGAHWTAIQVPNMRPNAIAAADANNAVIVGYRSSDRAGRWSKTTNGSSFSSPVGIGTTPKELMGVTMLNGNASTIVAVGKGATVLKTTTGGTAWSSLGPTSLPALAITSPTSLVLSPGPLTISGTSSQPNLGVAAAQVRVRRSDGKYWSGSSWDSVERWNIATTSDHWAHWSYDWVVDTATASGGYAVSVTARAVDAAGQIATTSLAPTGPMASVTRFAGSDRFQVAVSAAKTRWPNWTGVKHVIVVSGEDRALCDALSAAGLAGVYDAPILLTNSAFLSGATKSALAGMKARGPITIHVLGGTGSVSTAAYNQIRAYGATERISGSDRYVLSSNIAARVKSVAASNGRYIPGVLVFNAESTGAFYDALAASAVAAKQTMPMVAVRKAVVPAAASRALASFPGKPRYLTSGTTWISEAVRSRVGSTIRLARSSDRAVAATEIASSALARGWLGKQSVGLANKLPDSLCGGAFMGLNNGALVYTNATSLPASTRTFVSGLAGTANRGYMFGGTASISLGVQSTFLGLLNVP